MNVTPRPTKWLLALALPATLLVAGPAAATDRPPTPSEREAIEKVLKDAGFKSWEEIEFDDGHWEVDDARTADGREYDLKLDPKTLKIVSRRADN
ncbi:MAG: hypothetical protein CVT78_05770 [Alphaproteobacteria bacterium HGW-Alphaproteobacteria-17]|nr:MAG: hypothetical protein CVT78_05770 [Alphaproteobacteria bacterium HGW-Alphaproteobacteria-17]